MDDQKLKEECAKLVAAANAEAEKHRSEVRFTADDFAVNDVVGFVNYRARFEEARLSVPAIPQGGTEEDWDKYYQLAREAQLAEGEFDTFFLCLRMRKDPRWIGSC